MKKEPRKDIYIEYGHRQEWTQALTLKEAQKLSIKWFQQGIEMSYYQEQFGEFVKLDILA